jgi:hypothetical protein
MIERNNRLDGDRIETAHRAISPIAGENDSMKYVIKVGSLYVQSVGIDAQTVLLTDRQKDAMRYSSNHADDHDEQELSLTGSAGGRFVKLRPKARQ